MREIKVRVWDDDLKKMIPWERVKELFDFSDTEEPILTFLEYTGLKDRNGKEIYEGDIVRDGEGTLDEIKYETRKDGSYANWNFSYSLDEYGENPSKEWEVIGNIYENPELLK